jgi:hypothetical protein
VEQDDGAGAGEVVPGARSNVGPSRPRRYRRITRSRRSSTGKNRPSTRVTIASRADWKSQRRTTNMGEAGLRWEKRSCRHYGVPVLVVSIPAAALCRAGEALNICERIFQLRPSRRKSITYVPDTAGVLSPCSFWYQKLPNA